MNCLTCKYSDIIMPSELIPQNGTTIIDRDGNIISCTKRFGVTMTFASGNLECLDYEEKQTSDSK